MGVNFRKDASETRWEERIASGARLSSLKRKGKLDIFV
jgi:hypothetical protein